MNVWICSTDFRVAQERIKEWERWYKSSVSLASPPLVFSSLTLRITFGTEDVLLFLLSSSTFPSPFLSLKGHNKRGPESVLIFFLSPYIWRVKMRQNEREREDSLCGDLSSLPFLLLFSYSEHIIDHMRCHH